MTHNYSKYLRYFYVFHVFNSSLFSKRNSAQFLFRINVRWHMCFTEDRLGDHDNSTSLFLQICTKINV